MLIFVVYYAVALFIQLAFLANYQRFVTEGSTMYIYQLIENDTQKLTSAQAAEFRRRLSGVTHNLGVEAMEKYRYYLEFGGKRPFLHDSQSRIVAPMNREVVQWLQNFTKLPIALCKVKWLRQMYRFERNLDGGLKNCEDTVLDRMIAKRKEREVRKSQRLLRNVAPPRVQIELVEPVVAQQTVCSMYADTPVVYKKHGQKTTVLVVFNGDRKNAEVYSIENGIVRSVRSSVAQKYSEAELTEKGWKHGKLGDAGFERILSAYDLVAPNPDWITLSMEI